MLADVGATEQSLLTAPGGSIGGEAGVAARTSGPTAVALHDGGLDPGGQVSELSLHLVHPVPAAEQFHSVRWPESNTLHGPITQTHIQLTQAGTRHTDSHSTNISQYLPHIPTFN